MVNFLLQALMNVNSRLRELYPDSEELFDIVLMTNNHAQVGVRLINSINHYGTASFNQRVMIVLDWWTLLNPVEVLDLVTKYKTCIKEL